MKKNKFLSATALIASTMFLVVACDKKDDAYMLMDQPMPSMSAERIEAHMAYLASDDMKGRNTGSPEHREAAHYVADFYKDLGIMPGGDDGTYFQEVPFIKKRVDQEASGLTIMANGESTSFTSEQYVMTPQSNVAELIAHGDAVFVGYGIHAPDLGHDDFAGLDVTGKIIVRLIGSPAGLSPEEAQTLNGMKTEEGAAGVIGILTPTREARTPFQMYYNHFSGEQFGLDKGDEDGYIYAITSSAGAAALFEATGGDLAAAIEAADTKGFTAYGLNITASMKQVMDVERIKSPNVVGVLEGSDPMLKDEYVVISGHLDHVGDDCKALNAEGSTAAEGDTLCNGAMDNASGTATMMEVAKAFTSLEQNPRRSVMFLNVTAEEKGLMGSEWYSNNPTVPLDKIVANVNLDMPILLYDFADVVAFGGEHSSIGPIAAAALAEVNVGLADDPMPEENLFQRSDHFRFVQKGVPAVFLMTGPTAVGDDASMPVKEREGYKTFQKFLKTNYHGPGDDMSQAILFDVAAKYALANYVIIKALANSDVEPRWNEGNVWGDKYAPGMPRAAVAAEPAAEPAGEAAAE